jgi:hypothetical protein
MKVSQMRRPVTEEELIMAEDVEADRRRARAILAQLREPRTDLTGMDLICVLAWLAFFATLAVGIGLWGSRQ